MTATGRADIFIGLSAPNVLKPEMVKQMGDKPLVMALANPVPEIMPDDARAALMEKLNGVAERLRAGGNWPPEPRPTVEEMKQRIKELFARRDERP